MKSFHIFASIIVCIGLSGFLYFDFRYLPLTLIFFLIAGIFGGNIAYHRYISHGSFKTIKPVRYFLFFTMIMAGFGPPINWSYTHRLHHKNSDREGDPHNPEERGLLRSWFYLWRPNEKVNYLLVKDLLRQQDLVLFNKYYYQLSFLYVLLLFCINPALLIWAYAIPILLCLNGVSALVVLPNYHGYRNHPTPDRAHNSWIAHILSLGEGWHNNHHQNPRSYLQGRQNWWELDWCARLIEVIKT